MHFFLSVSACGTLITSSAWKRQSPRSLRVPLCGRDLQVWKKSEVGSHRAALSDKSNVHIWDFRCVFFVFYFALCRVWTSFLSSRCWESIWSLLYLHPILSAADNWVFITDKTSSVTNNNSAARTQNAIFFHRRSDRAALKWNKGEKKHSV